MAKRPNKRITKIKKTVKEIEADIGKAESRADKGRDKLKKKKRK